MYESIAVRRLDYGYSIVLNRPETGNTIHRGLLTELHLALDAVERDPDARLVILQGRDGVFCTGLDLEKNDGDIFAQYMQLLRRIATIPRVVIANVDGQVVAGGVGLVAVSDLAVATPRSRFSLSEALWGLLPACVTPYLIRRIGFQNAYRMTLTTLPVDAERAFAMTLIDEVSDNPEQVIRPWALRLTRLQNETIGNAKRFFRSMWMIDEETERAAVSEISRLAESPAVKENIRNFVERQVFPWNAGDPQK